jgi:Fe-S-cluster containining protein
MQFVPWRYVADWKCVLCGECCRLYSVVLEFPEWLWIVKNYGVEQTASDLSKLFIKRRSDGSCAFLNNGGNGCTCRLQHMKPRACQLWPFKVLSEPRYGYPNEASYFYGDTRVFVYADSMCRGLRLGLPTPLFANYVLREFVEIAAGVRINQFRTTSSIGPLQPYLGSRTLLDRTCY